MIRISIYMFIQRQLFYICRWILTYLKPEKSPSIPRIEDPLLELSAVALAKKIREREVSCLRVVRAYIDRINEVNSYLNAVVDDRFEAAISDAKAWDEKLKNGEVTPSILEKEKPLYGIPFTVKETCGLQGCSQGGMTFHMHGKKASEDSAIVKLLRDAGAIPLCVTNIPESSVGLDTSNLIQGRTLNPYDGRCTSGGSSGGEGALLGAGASLLGICSDLAGSARMPAHFNGVFGHKPTAGIIPINGHYPLNDDEMFRQWLVLGPMARYAEDLHAAVKVTSANCTRDLRLDEPVDFGKLRVYYLEDFDYNCTIRPSQEIRNCILQAANNFARKGCQVQRLCSNMFENFLENMFGIFFTKAIFPSIPWDPKTRKQRKRVLYEFGKSVLGLSCYTKSILFFRAQLRFCRNTFSPRATEYSQKGDELRGKIMDLLGEDGILLCPTFPTTAPLPPLCPLQWDSVLYCMLSNVFCFPATHVPMGLSEEGLPFGCQVMAAPYQDRLCLAVAKELENTYGGWRTPWTS